MRTPSFLQKPRVLELLVLFICIAIATNNVWRSLINATPATMLGGNEFSYLVNSGAIAARILERSGSIPLWNPFMGMGEPLFENPFSFVLNPLMTVPILIFKERIGALIAILIHALLLGFGGWLLAYVIGLKMPGRLLLGVLLAGSGSFTGALGGGFYQMALSQAYVPWVFAGLIGVLYRENTRRYTAILTVAAVLMIFAGTFWYVLPTAIGAVLITLFAPPRTWSRLIPAVAFTVGLSAVRMLPQIIHFDYIAHPLAALRRYVDMGILVDYLTSSTLGSDDVVNIDYHYIVPAAFLIGMIVLRPLARTSLRLRILIPVLVLITLWMAWAQENTPFVQTLYDVFPVLGEWRFLPRMLAAATPLIALVVAMWFDDAMRMLANTRRWWRIGFAALAIFGIAAGVDVLANWNRTVTIRTDVHPSAQVNADGINALRAQIPDQMISVLTFGFHYYAPFYDVLVRASFGNPDYAAGAIPPTIGDDRPFRNYPPFGVGTQERFLSTMEFLNFRELRTVRADFPAGLWFNRDAMPYAFITTRDAVTDMPQPESLSRWYVRPACAVQHHIDWIHVTACDYVSGAVLVVSETAYPGWEVRVNGENAPLESVGGRIGVTLPESGEPAEIIFRYEPTWLYLGAAISGAAFAAFAVFVLIRRSTSQTEPTIV